MMLLSRLIRTNDGIKKRLKHCGKDVRFGNGIALSGARSVVIGNNVHIGENAFIRGEGGLSIGDNARISRNLVLYTVNHNYHGKRLPYDETAIAKSVTIGRNVWIGMNVCITPGTTIGDGAIIGMGTVVFGEVPKFAIIGSAPWQVLGWRDDKHYKALDERGAYGEDGGFPWKGD